MLTEEKTLHNRFWTTFCEIISLLFYQKMSAIRNILSAKISAIPCGKKVSVRTKNLEIRRFFAKKEKRGACFNPSSIPLQKYEYSNCSGPLIYKTFP